MGLIGIAGLMGLSGCSDDPEAVRHYVSIEAQSYSTTFDVMEEDDESRALGSITRSWTPPTTPTTFYPYSSDDVSGMFANQKDLTNKSIGVFFTKESNKQDGVLFFKEDGKGNANWHLNNMEIESGSYQLYGYIPKEDADNANVEPLNGSFSNGAVLTINGLNTVTPSDVCVVVGAKEDNTNHDPNNDYTVSGLAPGNFDVTFNSGENAKNNLYLLFDHIYSSVRFGFKVAPAYNAMRTIKLKELELVALADKNGGGVKAKYKATITLKKNNTGASPIADNVLFEADNTSADVAPTSLYKGELTLSDADPQYFMGCFVPGVNTYFKLLTTYDVYDKNQAKDEHGNPILDSNGDPVYNLIRKNCQAENIIDLREKFQMSETVNGKCYTYILKVQPTYLYMLSEPDLDNPTLTIEH